MGGGGDGWRVERHVSGLGLLDLKGRCGSVQKQMVLLADCLLIVSLFLGTNHLKEEQEFHTCFHQNTLVFFFKKKKKITFTD